jgi:hypothetical protein
LTSSGRPLVAWLVPSALLAYAAFALGVARWWISGLAAPVVAVLLWRRHPRSRFSAYVFLSVVAIRGVATHRWPVLALAAPASRAHAGRTHLLE